MQLLHHVERHQHEVDSFSETSFDLIVHPLHFLAHKFKLVICDVNENVHEIDLSWLLSSLLSRRKVLLKH